MSREQKETVTGELARSTETRAIKRYLRTRQEKHHGFEREALRRLDSAQGRRPFKAAPQNVARMGFARGTQPLCAFAGPAGTESRTQVRRG